MIGALSGGLLAAAIHLAARWAERRWPAPERGVFGAGWMLGFLFRLGGVLFLGLGAGLRPDLFAPLPTALGFLGVLVPLLVTERRIAR